MKTRLIGYLLGMFLCLGLTGCSEPHGAPVLLPTASPVETLSPMQTITPSPRSFPTATSRPTATALPPATRTRILSYITHTAYPTHPPTLPAAQRNALLNLAWFPDGERFAVYTNYGVFFYDTVGLTKTEFMKFDNGDYELGHGFRIGAVAISQDGATIAISGKTIGAGVNFYDVRTGKRLEQLYINGQDGYFVTGLEFSPDDKALFVRSTNPDKDSCGTPLDHLALHILSRIDSAFETDVLNKRHCLYVPATYRFTKDGKFYLFRRSMGYDYAITLVKYTNPIIVRDDVYQYSDGEIFDASPDGSVLAKFWPDYTIELLDVKSNKLLPSKIRARRIFFLDGAKQFIIDWVNDWELWRNGKIVCGYAGVGGLPSWPFSANGKFFAGLTSGLTYDESVLQIWRIDDCRMLGSLSFSRYYH